jgi:hypothetical protein
MSDVYEPLFQEVAQDTPSLLQETAEDIAAAVLHHIDTMYPQMWQGVPKTARISLRNTIIAKVIAELTP